MHRGRRRNIHDRAEGAQLEATRTIDPEEMAELQLELGYPDRALAIYEELLRRDRHNARFARRRAWLAGLTSVRRRTIRRVGTPVPETADVKPPRGEPPSSPARPHEPTLRGFSGPARAGTAAVRALMIVHVGR